MEQKLIPTITDLTVIGDNITIYTYYDENDGELPNTIDAEIKHNVGIRNGVSYIENELLIDMKNNPENIDYVIDGSGNLIVIGDTGDISNYSIDNNGNLIYTRP